MTSHNITHGIYSQNRIRTALHRIVWRRAPHLTYRSSENEAFRLTMYSMNVGRWSSGLGVT